MTAPLVERLTAPVRVMEDRIVERVKVPHDYTLDELLHLFDDDGNLVRPLVLRVRDALAALNAAEQERDGLLDTVKQAGDAYFTVRQRADAAEARVAKLEGAIRDLLDAFHDARTLRPEFWNDDAQREAIAVAIAALSAPGQKEGE